MPEASRAVRFGHAKQPNEGKGSRGWPAGRLLGRGVGCVLSFRGSGTVPPRLTVPLQRLLHPPQRLRKDSHLMIWGKRISRVSARLSNVRHCKPRLKNSLRLCRRFERSVGGIRRYRTLPVSLAWCCRPCNCNTSKHSAHHLLSGATAAAGWGACCTGTRTGYQYCTSCDVRTARCSCTTGDRTQGRTVPEIYRFISGYRPFYFDSGPYLVLGLQQQQTDDEGLAVRPSET